MNTTKACLTHSGHYDAVRSYADSVLADLVEYAAYRKTKLIPGLVIIEKQGVDAFKSYKPGTFFEYVVARIKSGAYRLKMEPDEFVKVLVGHDRLATLNKCEECVKEICDNCRT